MKFKIAIDFVMTICMIFAMAVQVTDVYVHEILGVFLFLLFFIHNYLNRQWYRSLFIKNHTTFQLFNKIINILLSITMVVVFISGILISQHIFTFMAIDGSIFTRQVHKAAASWSYLLVSIHLGLHWLMFANMFNKTFISKTKAIKIVFMHITPVCILLYGINASFDQNIGSRLFNPSPFSFFSYNKYSVNIIVDYIAIMGMYVFITHNILKILNKAKNRT